MTIVSVNESNNSIDNINVTDLQSSGRASNLTGMGANLFDDNCSFRVWAPNAIAVAVELWKEAALKRISLYPEPSDRHYWSVDVRGVKAGQYYQFAIENKGGDKIGMPMRNLVKDANWVRSNNPALRSHTLQFIHEDRSNDVLAFKRWHEGGNIIVAIVNLSDRQWQNRDYGIDMDCQLSTVKCC